MKDANTSQHDQDPVGQLLSLVGESPPIAPATSERVRRHVSDRWQQTLQRRRRLRRVSLATAATVLLTAGMVLWTMLESDLAQDLKPVVKTARIVGDVQQIRDGNIEVLLPDAKIINADSLATLDGQLALRWESGHEVRLNHHSRIRVDSARQLTLQAGQLYVQGPGRDGPITVHTKVGPIRDIGTQFMVATKDSAVDISVREGEVSLTRTSGAKASIRAGFGLSLALAGDTADNMVPKPLTPEDVQWQWAFEIAPSYDTHNKTADDFLRWLVREKNWELNYANAEARRIAQQERLRGQLDPEGSAQQWLKDTMQTVGLTYELRETVLHISRR